MAKIKIITDSASDLPQHLADQYNVTILPLGIVIKGEVFYERETLDSWNYLKNLKTMDEIPTTTMVPIDRIDREFRKNLEEYDHQIFVTISSKSSGTFNTANMVKAQIEEELGKPSNITVIDSMAFSMLYGKIVLHIAKMAAQGASYEEIIRAYRAEQEQSNAYFVVDDLVHLQKGGRIKPGIALVGGLLGIKPILTIRDGLVDFSEKARGTARALSRIATLMIGELEDPSQAEIWVANGYADEEINQLLALLKDKITPKELNVFQMGACIGTHSGAGLVGLIFSKRV